MSDVHAERQNPDGSWSPAEPLRATWETDGRIMRWLASWVPWMRWREERASGKREGLG